MTDLVRGLCELTLQTTDPERLERWYSEIFGLRRVSRTPERIWLTAGPAARLGLWTPGEKEFGDEGGRHVHFAFRVAPGDLRTIARALGERGHPCRGPVEHEGGDRSLYVTDPEGNVVEAWDYFEGAEGRRDGVDGLG